MGGSCSRLPSLRDDVSCNVCLTLADLKHRKRASSRATDLDLCENLS